MSCALHGRRGRRAGLRRRAQILVANKVDLVDKRVVDRAALQEMSETHGVEVIEVRAALSGGR